MLRKRRLMAVPMIVATILLIAACGSSGKGKSTSAKDSASKAELVQFEQLVKKEEAPITKWPAEAPTETVTPPKGKTIVDITISATEPAALRTAEGVVEAAKVIGWKGKILYGEFSDTKTREAFEQAIILGASVIVTQGIEPNKYTDLFQKAHEHGIVIVTCYSDYPTSKKYAQAEISEYSRQSGVVAAAKAIVTAGGHGQFALFNYPEYAVLNHRMGAAKQELEKCKGCEVVAYTNISSAEAEKTLPPATSAVLTKYPNLTGIINGIDTFADLYQLPTMKELKSKVPLYTFLGGQPTLEAVNKGEVEAVVADPLRWGGWAAVDSAIRVLDKKPVGEGGVPERILTKSTVGPALKSGEGWTGDYDYKAEYERLWGVK